MLATESHISIFFGREAQDALFLYASAKSLKTEAFQKKLTLKNDPDKTETLLKLLSEWRRDYDVAKLLEAVAGEKIVSVDWLNSACFAKHYMQKWVKLKDVNGKMYEVIQPMVPVIAQCCYLSLIRAKDHYLGFCLELLELLGNRLACFHESDGSLVDKELAMTDAILTPLFKGVVSEDCLFDTLEEWKKYEASQAETKDKLKARLLASISGSLEAQEGLQICSQVISDAVDGRRLPELCAQLLQGPWLSSLQYIYINEGTKSSFWRVAKEFTQLIVESCLPSEKLADVISVVEQKLYKLLFSLHHLPAQRRLWVEQIQELHLKLLHKIDVACDTLPELPSHRFQGQAEVSLSQDLIRSVTSLHPGDWLIFDEPKKCRAELLMISRTGQIVIFNNIFGKKIFEFSIEDLAYKIARGSVHVIDEKKSSISLLRSIMDDAYHYRQEINEQKAERRAQKEMEEKLREEARIKASAEAEALRFKQEEEHLKFLAEKQQQEEYLKQLTEEKEKLAEEKLRLELKNTIHAMPVGTWITVLADEDVDTGVAVAAPLTLKLAVRLDSSKKLLFTDSVGLKKTEFKADELFQLMLDKKVVVSGAAVDFNDTLAEVVQMGRTKK